MLSKWIVSIPNITAFSYTGLKNLIRPCKDHCYRNCILILHYFIYNVDFIVYDDACHLRRFARNPVRSDGTEHSKHLASVEMVVDKMHTHGHIDNWCQQHYDSAKFHQLNKVDTGVCKQVFLWISRSDHTSLRRWTNIQCWCLSFLLLICEPDLPYSGSKPDHSFQVVLGCIR